MNTSSQPNYTCLALRRASKKAKTMTEIETWFTQILDNTVQDGHRTISPEAERRVLSEFLTMLNLREQGGDDKLPHVVDWAKDMKKRIELELDRDIGVIMARDRLEKMQREVFLQRFDRYNPDSEHVGGTAPSRTWNTEDENAWAIRSDPYLNTFLSYNWKELNDVLAYEEAKSNYLNAKSEKDHRRAQADRKWARMYQYSGAPCDTNSPFADFMRRLLSLSNEWDYDLLRQYINLHVVGQWGYYYNELEAVAHRGHFARLANFLAADLAETTRAPVACEDLVITTRVAIMREVNKYFDQWDWDYFMNCLNNFVPKAAEQIPEVDDWSTASELGELVLLPAEGDRLE